MSRVDFYHLQNQTLENVLPKLLEKAYETGKKVKIKVGNEERVEFINTFYGRLTTNRLFRTVRARTVSAKCSRFGFRPRRQPKRRDDAVSG